MACKRPCNVIMFPNNDGFLNCQLKCGHEPVLWCGDTKLNAMRMKVNHRKSPVKHEQVHFEQMKTNKNGTQSIQWTLGRETSHSTVLSQFGWLPHRDYRSRSPHINGSFNRKYAIFTGDLYQNEIDNSISFFRPKGKAYEKWVQLILCVFRLYLWWNWFLPIDNGTIICWSLSFVYCCYTI